MAHNSPGTVGISTTLDMGNRMRLAPASNATCRLSAMKLWFESRIPLGSPVVPPEKRIAAGSWVETDAVGLERRQPPRRFGVGRDLFGLIPDGLRLDIEE